MAILHTSEQSRLRRSTRFPSSSPKNKVAVLLRRSPRLLESGRQHSKDDPNTFRHSQILDEQGDLNIRVTSHSRSGKIPPLQPNVSPPLVLRRSSRLSIPESPDLNTSNQGEISISRNELNLDSRRSHKTNRECNTVKKRKKSTGRADAENSREGSKVVPTKKRKKQEENDEGRSVEWTNVQETALHRAYFSVTPTPNFWKQVSKKVPRKSAQECYDKIHSDYKSPLPRSRLKKTKLDGQSLELSASKVLKLRKSNTKPKHKLPRATVNSMRKKHLSDAKPILNLSNGGDFSSPAVLKPVKNIGLHEKYVGQLYNREMKRKAASNSSKEDTNLVEQFHFKAAKSALLSQAKSAVSQYLH